MIITSRNVAIGQKVRIVAPGKHYNGDIGIVNKIQDENDKIWAIWKDGKNMHWRICEQEKGEHLVLEEVPNWDK